MYKAYSIPGNQAKMVKMISTIQSVPHPRARKTATGGKKRDNIMLMILAESIVVLCCAV